MTCAIDFPIHYSFLPLDGESIVMWIDPKQFLYLAKQAELSNDLFDFNKVPNWEEWPTLIIDPDSKVVHGHEGRHRVNALMNTGFQRIQIIVELTPDPLRFEMNIEQMMLWEWDGTLINFDALLPEDEYVKSIL